MRAVAGRWGKVPQAIERTYVQLAALQQAPSIVQRDRDRNVRKPLPSEQSQHDGTVNGAAKCG